MTTPVERLLTAADVAERLQISQQWAAKLITRGEIAATRIGRKVRVTEESLADYIARNTAKPRSSRRGAAA